MNVLYLHTHDWGRYIGPFGHAVPTPNLQKLAEESTMFRRCFSLNPTCSPSRAGLLTGRYPHNNGMLGLAHRGFRLSDYSQHIVQYLKTNGYYTALSSSGAQHVAPKAEQEIIGYDQIFDPEFPGSKDVLGEIDTFLAGIDKPFFLSVGFGDTHRKFGEPAAEEPATDPRYATVPAPLPDTPEIRRDMAAFASRAKEQDAKMGAVLDSIEKHGHAGNTLVICTTDHGIAFPSMKCNLTDHGTGVFLFLRAPGSVPAGAVVDAMVSHLDVFPTICDLLDLPRPDWLQGQSLTPLLRRTQESLHEYTYGEVNYHAAYEPMRCVRTDRYLYVRRFEEREHPVLPNCDDGPSKDHWLSSGWWDRAPDMEQLYDRVFDPNQVRNFIDEPAYSEVATRLSAELDRWMAETDDPLLDGEIPAPEGARITDSDARSNSGPLRSR